MKLRSLTYRSFPTGHVGIDVETGGGDAPLSFTPKELHKFILHVRRIQPVYLVNLRHSEYVQEETEEIVEFVGACQSVGLPVWSEWDGEDMPGWLKIVQKRTVHITSEPWNNYGVHEVVYHPDETGEPQLSSWHLSGSLLLVQVETRSDVEKAMKFMAAEKLKGREWLLRIAPRFPVLWDLTEFNVQRMGEELP